MTSMRRARREGGRGGDIVRARAFVRAQGGARPRGLPGDGPCPGTREGRREAARGGPCPGTGRRLCRSSGICQCPGGARPRGLPTAAHAVGPRARRRRGRGEAEARRHPGGARHTPPALPARSHAQMALTCGVVMFVPLGSTSQCTFHRFPHATSGGASTVARYHCPSYDASTREPTGK